MNKLLTIEDIKNKIVEEGKFRLIQENDTADTYVISSGIFVTQFVTGDKTLYITIGQPFSRKDSITICRKNNLQNHSTKIEVNFCEKKATLTISASRFIPQEFIEIESFDGKKIMGTFDANLKIPSLKFRTNLGTVLECVSIGECTKENIINVLFKLMLGEVPNNEYFTYAKPGITLVIEEYIKSVIIYLTNEANKNQEEINKKLKVYEEVCENNGILTNAIAEGLEELESNNQLKNRK